MNLTFLSVHEGCVILIMVSIREDERMRGGGGGAEEVRR